MQEIHGTATGTVNAAPDPTFRLITDIDRLPDWNRAIERIVDAAPDLSPGIEWVVKMHPSRGMTWQSRSRVEEIDREARRFRYRTWNADGNPSYADWKWEVVPQLDFTAQVSVNWDVYLKTLDRKWLAGPIRQRQLRKEVAESLRARSTRVSAASDREHLPQDTRASLPRPLARKGGVWQLEPWSSPSPLMGMRRKRPAVGGGSAARRPLAVQGRRCPPVVGSSVDTDTAGPGSTHLID